ncbi:MAG TPA: DUF3810 domain-containing protein [Blastocatellia bacterium]|nr:DUF3810 domain-containing protein [Blastocatellia bacterium]
MSKATRSHLLSRPLGFLKGLPARGVVNLTVIALALALALVRLPASAVERFYSNGIYPVFQSALTPLTNLFPFAVLDVMLVTLAVALPAWWIARIVRAERGRRLRTAARLLFDTLVIASLFLLGFQLLWGLNYERRPLVSKLDYDERRLSLEGIHRLRLMTIERLNAQYQEARGVWPGEAEWRAKLHASLNETVKQLGNRRSVAAATPKTSLLDIYLSAAGIEGFVNPFGHEVILNREILPFEKPFLLAHEWAHLAGFADESEANFVGLVTCLQSDMAAVRYSGLLTLYQYIPALPAESSTDNGKGKAPPDPTPRLAPQVIADLEAIREREDRNVNATISRAQWAFYDRFLKASGVEAGVASYSQFVRLVLGTRFENGWTPARRDD